MRLVHARSVDDYIGLQPAPMQRILERVRKAIRDAVPEAEELISYKMPAYKFHGRVLLYFGGWPRHYALYPAGSGRVVSTFKDDLAACDVTKGTIRFALSQSVPVKLIGRIAKFRAKEITERESAKTRAKKNQ